MEVTGHVFSGVLRGHELIEKYYPRLIGLLGFKPFLGTMDVKLDEKLLNIRPYTTKTVEHRLISGTVHRDALLAPVTVSIKKEGQEKSLDCWVIQFEDNIYKHDVLEILAAVSVRETLGVEDGDQLKITFTGKAAENSMLKKIRFLQKGRKQ